MILTGTFYLLAQSERLWIEPNPDVVEVSAYNIQTIPFVVRIWSGEGSYKTELPAYLTLVVESVVGSSSTKLYEYKSTGKVSSYSYTLPSNNYATANRISVYAHEDLERTKEIDSRQVNIVAPNPTPFPRAEDWSSDLLYKNGEYLMQDDVMYMWTSRVSGNTPTDPKTWIQNNPASGLWTPYPYNKLLAAQILFAKFALIGSAVFMDEFMYSQQGVNASGNPTNDYRGLGTDAFTPNILLDFLNGKANFKDATIKGVIEAISGSIGGFEIASGRIGKAYNEANPRLGMSLYDSFIVFNSTKRQALIGTTDSLGAPYLGSFVDTYLEYSSSGVALPYPKWGIVFDIRNGLNNHAISGEGNGTLNGIMEGYSAQTINPPLNTCFIPSIEKGNRILCRFTFSGSSVGLPSLSDVQNTLSIGKNKPFTCRITYICVSHTTAGGIYGRTTEVTGMNTYQYPQRLNNNASVQNGRLDMESGDVDEFMLVYDGGNTETSYRAFWLANRH